MKSQADATGPLLLSALLTQPRKEALPCLTEQLHMNSSHFFVDVCDLRSVFFASKAYQGLTFYRSTEDLIISTAVVIHSSVNQHRNDTQRTKRTFVSQVSDYFWRLAILPLCAETWHKWFFQIKPARLKPRLGSLKDLTGELLKKLKHKACRRTKMCCWVLLVKWLACIQVYHKAMQNSRF